MSKYALNKYTPGPWKASPAHSGLFDVLDASGKDIVTVYGGGVGSQFIEANARLIAAGPEMVDALDEGRRAIGDHFAPGDCYATGPLTGDPIRDLVQCPACSFIGMYEAVMAKIASSSSSIQEKSDAPHA